MGTDSRQSLMLLQLLLPVVSWAAMAASALAKEEDVEVEDPYAVDAPPPELIALIDELEGKTDEDGMLAGSEAGERQGSYGEDAITELVHFSTERSCEGNARSSVQLQVKLSGHWYPKGDCDCLTIESPVPHRMSCCPDRVLVTCKTYPGTSCEAAIATSTFSFDRRDFEDKLRVGGCAPFTMGRLGAGYFQIKYKGDVAAGAKDSARRRFGGVPFDSAVLGGSLAALSLALAAAAAAAAAAAGGL